MKRTHQTTQIPPAASSLRPASVTLPRRLGRLPTPLPKRLRNPRQTWLGSGTGRLGPLRSAIEARTTATMAADDSWQRSRGKALARYRPGRQRTTAGLTPGQAGTEGTKRTGAQRWH
jgi:hypothetical protein